MRSRFAFKAFRETEFQKQDRLDKECHALSMGARSHAEFRAQSELKLDEMEDAGMASDSPALRRQYLSKLTDDLRQAVLDKLRPLDGEHALPRKPSTWEEVSDAIDLELSTRADTKAPTEMLAWSDEHRGTAGSPPAKSGGGKGCRVCQSREYVEAACPQKAARDSGEEEHLLARSARSGETCSICGAAGHRKKHHAMASKSYCKLDTNFYVRDFFGDGVAPAPAGGAEPKGKGKGLLCEGRLPALSLPVGHA